MKQSLLLTAALCGATLLTGCEYDDDDDYRVRRVSVSTATPYYGDYDEYTPYYSHSGRRYYRSSGRYVYYDARRPMYVTTVPRGAVYVNPPRQTTSTTRVVRHHFHDHDDDDD